MLYQQNSFWERKMKTVNSIKHKNEIHFATAVGSFRSQSWGNRFVLFLFYDFSRDCTFESSTNEINAIKLLGYQIITLTVSSITVSNSTIQMSDFIPRIIMVHIIFWLNFLDIALYKSHSYKVDISASFSQHLSHL